MFFRASLLAAVVCSFTSFAQDAGAPVAVAASSDETSISALDAEARFLAGLSSGPTGPFAQLEQTPAWKTHRTELDGMWTKLETKRLTPMREWAKAELWPRIDAKASLVYFFGGPDAISADVLYPEAPTMVLCGLERPGQTAPLDKLPATEVEDALTSLRRTIRTTVDMSYFITSRMGGDMIKSPLKGVLPVLFLFLARNGEHLVDVQSVAIDSATGAMTPVETIPETGAGGWRIHFRRGAGDVTRELVYLRLDLSNPVANKTPGFFTWLESLGTTNSFLKAASYIMHDRNFSRSRGYLLDHCGSVLEDDSGIPFKFLNTPDYELTYFGTYTPPKGQFVKAIQEQMLKSWSTAEKHKLPFKTGYAHSGSDSHLLLARKKPATPDAGVPAPAPDAGK
jgi:hypothetical protein